MKTAMLPQNDATHLLTISLSLDKAMRGSSESMCYTPPRNKTDLQQGEGAREQPAELLWLTRSHGPRERVSLRQMGSYR